MNDPSRLNPRYAHPLQGMAGQIAQQGRYGDSTLVHVSPHELKGLAALSPTGRLTRNPHTGMPEAFGLGSILGLLGSIAGVVAAPYTGGASLALSAGVGAGLGTAGGDLIEGKSAGSALSDGVLSGLLSYGLGSAAQGLGDAGTQSALDAAKGSGASVAGSGPFGSIGSSSAGDLSPYAFADQSGAWGGLGTGGGASEAAMREAISSGAVPVSGPAAGPAMGLASPQTMEGLTGSPPPGFNFNPSGTYDPSASQGSLLQPKSYGSSLGDQFSARGGAALRGATDPNALWQTFGTNAGSTTIPIGLGLAGMASMNANDANSNSWMPQQGQQQHNYPTVPGPNQRQYRPRPSNWDYTTGKEWDYFTPAFADGGYVNPMTLSGTTRGLDRYRYHGETADMQDALFEDRHLNNQADNAAEQMDRQMSENEGPGSRYGSFSTPFDGSSPTVRYARGGYVAGPGGGIEDMIPAIIDKRHPAALSSGEFVVPAHAVSALGNGSSEEGSRQLNGMVSNILTAKYGSADRKPNPIDPSKMLGGVAKGDRPFDQGYAGGGIVDWIKDKWQGNPPTQDPARSWDMDPMPQSYPTVEDARQQRLYNIKYGNPNERTINNETKMSREPAEGLVKDINNGSLFLDPSKPKPIGWDMADYMQRAQMGANQSPVAALGFDPEKMSYTPDAQLTWHGATDPETNRIWLDSSKDSVPVHESMHRGHRLMLQDPEGRALMERFSGHGREMLVRSDMQRRFGPDIEAGTDKAQLQEGAERLKDDDWRKKMREIDKVAHRMIAEKTIAKAGGVYAGGGLVRYRG